MHYWLVLKFLDAEAQVYERNGLVSNGRAKWPCEENKRIIRVV
jgi:hypothetical protein